MKHRLDSQLKRWLVEEASGIADLAAEQRGVQTSQLRNMLQIAQVESEVAVLRNFLEYQAGRRATRDFWEPIHARVVGVLEEIPRRLTGDERLQRLAILSFFGYMVRRYVYATEAQKSHRRQAGGQSTHRPQGTHRPHSHRGGPR